MRVRIFFHRTPAKGGSNLEGAGSRPALNFQFRRGEHLRNLSENIFAILERFIFLIVVLSKLVAVECLDVHFGSFLVRF